MKLGDYIKNYRMTKNLSQRQFAALCGISNGYISMLEEGRNPRTNEPLVPSLVMLNKIATGMNMTVHDLISVVDDMPISFSDSDEKAFPAPLSIDPVDDFVLSPHEKALVSAYRDNPAMQSAVDKLLGIDTVDSDIAQDMIETIRTGSSLKKRTNTK